MKQIKKTAVFNTTSTRWSALQVIADDLGMTVPEYLMSLAEDKLGEKLHKLETAYAKVEEVLKAEKQAG